MEKVEQLNCHGKIRFLIMDVDGTLTDGKLYIGAEGELFKAFHVKDGCAIHDILPRYAIVPVIITARKSAIVEHRCCELDVKECYQGVRNKRKKLVELAEGWGLETNAQGVYDEIAYVGDDIMDLDCMRICGFTACPNNAAKEVREYVNYVSTLNGGEGAVRDIVEKVIE